MPSAGGFVPDVGDGGTLDLYRTKVTPEMLDSFQMDPKIGNKDGVARAVFFEADSFPAEKIGVGGVYDESTSGIKYQPHSTPKPSEFYPAVKGIGYTPGENLFPNLVPTGNSQMSNSISAAGRSAPRSIFLVEYWQRKPSRHISNGFCFNNIC